MKQQRNYTYSMYKNKLTQFIKKSKDNYFKNKKLSPENNSKQIWKIINFAIYNVKKRSYKVHRRK